MAKLQRTNFSDIHTAIIDARNLKSAAGKLGVADHTLSAHLAQVYHADEPLSYERLKAMSADALGAVHEAPMVAKEEPAFSGYKRGRAVDEEEEDEEEEGSKDEIETASKGKRSRTASSGEETATTLGSPVLDFGSERRSPLSELLAMSGMFGRIPPIIEGNPFALEKLLHTEKAGDALVP